MYLHKIPVRHNGIHFHQLFLNSLAQAQLSKTYLCQSENKTIAMGT